VGLTTQTVALAHSPDFFVAIFKNILRNIVCKQEKMFLLKEKSIVKFAFSLYLKRPNIISTLKIVQSGHYGKKIFKMGLQSFGHKWVAF